MKNRIVLLFITLSIIYLVAAFIKWDILLITKLAKISGIERGLITLIFFWCVWITNILYNEFFDEE